MTPAAQVSCLIVFGLQWVDRKKDGSECKRGESGDGSGEEDPLDSVLRAGIVLDDGGAKDLDLRSEVDHVGPKHLDSSSEVLIFQAACTNRQPLNLFFFFFRLCRIVFSIFCDNSR